MARAVPQTLALRIAACSFLFLSTAAGQPQSRGVPPEWEIRENVERVLRHASEMEAVLLEVIPQLWFGDGPKESYEAQLQAARDEIGYARRAAQALAARPERLTLVLETYLRLQSAGELLVSLAEGVRRYQSEPVADRIRAKWSEGAQGRDKLREYMVSLAEEYESQAQVMADEAQRCRELLIRQPPQAPPPNKRESK